MNAIAYTRFSPRPGASECDSCEKQLADIRRYCEGKGYTLVGEFSDPAVSGSEEDRPGLWEAIRSLKRGYVLIVRDLDRLARSVQLQEFLFQAVKARRATIEATTGGDAVNGDQPERVLVRQILGAIAEYHRRLTGVRTKHAMLRHQANGRKMSERVPFGMRSRPEDMRRWEQERERWLASGNSGRFRPSVQVRLEPDPGEQQAIARILALAGEGLKYREIARRMDAEGIACRGHAWHHDMVRKILARSSACV